VKNTYDETTADQEDIDFEESAMEAMKKVLL
jgi:hypothetical protein